MKVPRDVDGDRLVKALKKLGYEKTRQSGSHIRLTRIIDNNETHITIPNHDPIKIGTLNNILKDVSEELNITKEELINKLFNK